MVIEVQNEQATAAQKQQAKADVISDLLRMCVISELLLIYEFKKFNPNHFVLLDPSLIIAPYSTYIPGLWQIILGVFCINLEVLLS